MWSCNTEIKSFAGPETSPDSQTTNEPVILPSGIWETKNDHSVDLHDDEKSKLTSDSGQPEEDEQDQKQSGNEFVPTIWTTREIKENHCCSQIPYFPSYKTHIRDITRCAGIIAKGYLCKSFTRISLEKH